MKTLIRLYIENRKYQRVLAALRLESKRLGLLRGDRGASDVQRYLDELVAYLEDA